MAKAKAKSRWTLCAWDGGVLRPYADQDAEDLGHLQQGRVYRTDVANFRSVPRHRLYRAILRVVVENHEHLTDVDSLNEMLLLACGVTKPLLTVEGEIQLLPHSTAFEAMGEDQFKPFFNEAMRIITEQILPGVDLEALLEEARSRTKWSERP